MNWSLIVSMQVEKSIILSFLNAKARLSSQVFKEGKNEGYL